MTESSRSWGILETIAVAFLGFAMANVLAIAIALVAIMVAGKDIAQNLEFNLLLLVITNTVFLGVIGLYMLARKISLKQLGLQKPKSATSLLIVVPVFFSYALTLFIVDSALRYFVPGLNLDQEQEIIFKEASGFYQMIVAALALMVVAPITEELIFRGFVFRGFRGRLGFLTAAVISSALFGLAHGQLNVAVDTFILGVFLCYVYEKTKSIWVPIGLHALKNSLAFYLIFFTDISS